MHRVSAEILFHTFQAKVLLFMTFWTKIDPYHMFYIMIYVTLKLTEHGMCLCSAAT